MGTGCDPGTSWQPIVTSGTSSKKSIEADVTRIAAMLVAILINLLTLLALVAQIHSLSKSPTLNPACRSMLRSVPIGTSRRRGTIVVRVPSSLYLRT